ncbi:FUSC family protein [Sediminibacillus albus]|nr:FUSC family protein [Sediminibacillus albus]
MKHLHIKHHWLGRFLASDPGRKRFQQAGKATISLISSVFTMLFILRVTGNPLFTPVLIAGIVGMLGIMTVMDDTKQKKQVTTLLLGVSAIIGVSLGSLLAGNAYYVGTLMILVIFSAFYFSRFGSRYFSLGMIGFMTVYFSSFLKLSPDQFLWFYLGILIGVFYAFIYNFIVFKDSAQVLKKSMRSFHIQANLTFNILIRIIEELDTSKKRMKSLEKNVHLLGEYARNVSEDLNAQDVKKVWPGLDSTQVRLYVFDAAMLVETLGDSIQRLKKAEALEAVEIRRLLIWIVRSLRDAEVLAQGYEQKNLEEAAHAVQAIRLLLSELLEKQAEPAGWLFLIRRIESIANHVIKGGTTIQQSLLSGSDYDSDRVNDENQEEDESDEEEALQEGMKPSTRKALQSLVTGTIAIFAGYLISPVQPYWILLTSFIIQLGTDSVGRTYIKGFQRSLGTIFGAVIGFLLANLLSGHSVLEVTLLFCVVFLAFYLFAVSYTLMSLFITMLIAFLYDILLGGISLTLMGARVIDTIAGAAIALGVSAVVFPKKTRDKVAESFDEYLKELKPFVIDYVKRFREDVDVKSFADNAFNLDQKLQAVRDDAQSLLQRPGTFNNANLSRWITIFTAINYYAKHLIASSYQKKFIYPDELIEDFKQMEAKLAHNIETLGELLKGRQQEAVIYNLSEERERIERLAPSRKQAQGDLIHHVYYIWRINQSIVVLSLELGAEEK